MEPEICIECSLDHVQRITLETKMGLAEVTFLYIREVFSNLSFTVTVLAKLWLGFRDTPTLITVFVDSADVFFL